MTNLYIYLFSQQQLINEQKSEIKQHITNKKGKMTEDLHLFNLTLYPIVALCTFGNKLNPDQTPPPPKKVMSYLDWKCISHSDCVLGRILLKG